MAKYQIGGWFVACAARHTVLDEGNSFKTCSSVLQNASSKHVLQNDPSWLSLTFIDVPLWYDECTADPSVNSSMTDRGKEEFIGNS